MGGELWEDGETEEPPYVGIRSRAFRSALAFGVPASSLSASVFARAAAWRRVLRVSAFQSLVSASACLSTMTSMRSTMVGSPGRRVFCALATFAAWAGLGAGEEGGGAEL